MKACSISIYKFKQLLQLPFLRKGGWRVKIQKLNYTTRGCSDHFLVNEQFNWHKYCIFPHFKQ